MNVKILSSLSAFMGLDEQRYYMFNQFWDGSDRYIDYIDNLDIPVYDDFQVDNVKDCDLGAWDRTGAKGAIVSLKGQEIINNLHVHEIPKSEALEPEKSLYEKLIYVIQGTGATAIGPEDNETIVEWDQNTLFALPRGVRHQHINTSNEEPVRLVAETDLPTLLSFFGDPDFIFDTDFSEDTFSGKGYSTKGDMYESPRGAVVWESNFIPDILSFDKIRENPQRGAGGATVLFHQPATSMWAHMSEFPAGTYKKGHRHYAGATILVLSGEGYSYMWPSIEGDFDDRVRIDWQPGTVFTPPSMWWHQHYNTSLEPARYMAFHPPIAGDHSTFEALGDHNNIQYPNEHPEIREIFESELRSKGIEPRMPEEAYSDPNYSFKQNYTSLEQTG